MFGSSHETTTHVATARAILSVFLDIRVLRLSSLSCETQRMLDDRLVFFLSSVLDAVGTILEHTNDSATSCLTKVSAPLLDAALLIPSIRNPGPHAERCF